MSLKYERVNWQNNVTPLNQDNLNKMDAGIVNATSKINELEEYLDNLVIGGEAGVAATFDASTGTLKLTIR